jgi:thymidine kinase
MREILSHSRHNTGWIEVIVGSMFSGKTEELIRRVRRAQLAKQKVQVFKPSIDNRYSLNEVTSHSDQRIQSEVVVSAAKLLENLSDSTRVVGIDEGQFFGESLIEVCERLANRGLRVIVAGLDTDFRGDPFHPMPYLMAIAESVTKQHAICMVCGAQACRTQRIVSSQSDILIGAADAYEARCRGCFEPPTTSVLDFDRIENSNQASVDLANLHRTSQHLVSQRVEV